MIKPSPLRQTIVQMRNSFTVAATAEKKPAIRRKLERHSRKIVKILIHRMRSEALAKANENRVLRRRSRHKRREGFQ